MKRNAYLLLITLLLLLLAFFVVLTFDSVGKLISQRAVFEKANLLFVLYLELSRALTTLTALALAIALVARASDAAHGRALALFLVFISMTYEKVFGTTGYPGPLQGVITEALLGAGVTRSSLIWIFGPMPWSFWLALAAVIRFSVVFPPPGLSAQAIDKSGMNDRRGVLRGSSVAGADIGAAFRALSKQLLTAGGFGAGPVWSAALILAGMTTWLSSSARNVLLFAVFVLVAGFAITNLRAAHYTAEAADQRRMHWLTLAFSLGGAIFVTAALPLLFFNDPLTLVPALILLMVAPAVTMLCLAIAVLYRGSIDAGRILAAVPNMSAHVLALLILFAGLASLSSAVIQDRGTWRALALLGAVAITATAAAPLRRLTDRFVTRVLERTTR